MWTKARLHALLDERVLVFDGAMGTQLYEQGHDFDSSFDALCLTRPLLVRRVHRDFVAAGAQVLTTNTFGANPIRLAAADLGERCGELKIGRASCRERV